MFSIRLLLLIGALSSGVIAFGAGAPPVWTWGKTSFVVFFLLAVVAFVQSELKRPSLMWAVYDDLHSWRIRRRLRGSLDE